MGSRVQSSVGCFPEFFFQFSLAQVLVGFRQQFLNNFVIPTWACAAGFNNNKKIFNASELTYFSARFASVFSLI